MSFTLPQAEADAVARIAAMDTPDAAPEPVKQEAATEEVAEAAPEEYNPETADPDEAVAEGPEAGTEGEDAEDQGEQPPVDAPQFWSKEAKEHFVGLDRATQEFLVEQDKAAQKAINAKFEEAASVRKAAQEHEANLIALKGRLESVANSAQTAFADKWEGMTDALWLQLARTNPQEYTALKAEYDAEQGALQQAKAAEEAAQQVERQQWLRTQAEELKTYAPDLADPVKGKDNFQKTLDYLVERGAKEQDLGDVSAAVMALAWDSYQLRQIRNNPARAVPRPVPKSGLPSAASVAAVSSQDKEVQRLKNRAAQTKNPRDQVALLMAKGIL